MIKYLRWAIRLVLLALVATGAVWAVNWTVTHKLDRLRDDQSSQSADATSLKTRERQLLCMTQNIYYEAGSEPAEGKLAVAQVVMNRSKSGQFPEDLCKVIYQKNVFYEKTVCQFSWYCENTHKIRPVYKPLWEESELVAKKVLLENFRLPSLNKALYYHADYVNPNWKKPKIEQIGRHIFYGERT
jgi:spore germination cell wall hydrolase CwlJ-like protein